MDKEAARNLDPRSLVITNPNTGEKTTVADLCGQVELGCYGVPLPRWRKMDDEDRQLVVTAAFFATNGDEKAIEEFVEAMRRERKLTGNITRPLADLEIIRGHPTPI